MPSSCAFSCLLAVPIKATHRQLPLEWYSSMVWVGMKAWWVRRNKASPPKWLKYTNSPLHQCEHNTFKSTYSHENRTFWDFTQKCTVSSEHYVISAPLKIAFVRWKYSSVSCQGLFFAAPPSLSPVTGWVFYSNAMFLICHDISRHWKCYCKWAGLFSPARQKPPTLIGAPFNRNKATGSHYAFIHCGQRMWILLYFTKRLIFPAPAVRSK